MEYLPAAAAAVALVTPALADFYIVQDTSTKRCKIVEQRPTTSTMTIVSRRVGRNSELRRSQTPGTAVDEQVADCPYAHPSYGLMRDACRGGLGRAGLRGVTIRWELGPALPRPLRFFQPRLCGVQYGGLLVRIGAFDGQQQPFGGMKEMVFHGNTSCCPVNVRRPP
jgi:hypothetical protein